MISREILNYYHEVHKNFKALGVRNDQLLPKSIRKNEYIGGYFYQNSYQHDGKTLETVLNAAGLTYSRVKSISKSGFRHIDLDALNSTIENSSITHVSISYPIQNPSVTDSILLQILRTILGGGSLYQDRKSSINLRSKILDAVSSSGFVESCYSNYFMHKDCSLFTIEYQG